MTKKQLEEITGKFKRDENGLVLGEEYIFNEDGSINWRYMIKPEHLYVNKGWFEERGKEVPESPAGLKDHQVLIMLGGIKELAKLRGFSSLTFPFVESSNKEKGAFAKCRIEWIGNYETNFLPVVYEDCASATTENTEGVFGKFLETIACNRALIRCVRNFLNIHVVGYDEMNLEDFEKSHSVETEDPSSKHGVPTPHSLLEKICQEKGINTFEDFKQDLRSKWEDKTYRNEDAKNWKSYKDIPAKECRILSSLLKGS